MTDTNTTQPPLYTPRTFDRVTRLLVEQLGADEEEVRADSTFDTDLGADSLDAVEVIMAVEEEFGIEISDDDAEPIVASTTGTVADLATLVQAKLDAVGKGGRA